MWAIHLEGAMGASQTVLPFKLAANGTEETHEMVNGHRPTNTISPEPIGLTLGEGKSILAANADPADSSAGRSIL